MEFATPFEPRKLPDGREKRLRKITSVPLRQNQLPSGGYQNRVGWNQSAVNLLHSISSAPPPPPYYGQPFSQPQTQPRPDHEVVQQRNWASTSDLPIKPPWAPHEDQVAPVTEENLHDVIGERLSEIISRIDEDTYSGSNKDLIISIPQTPPPSYSRNQTLPSEQNYTSERSLLQYRRPSRPSQALPNRNINVLAKLSYYSNSRLPASLPPFRVYLPTYPLLCLAALCSANAYQCRPNAVKDEQLISANARIGSKAMVIKSVTRADEQTIVIAIRGTSVLNLRDWNVNLMTTPESPVGFLDDEGNYCHSGFLRVAKAMIKPIANHLRHLLEENPSRLNYSLLITGHSAGGAVASLLYTHMLSEHVKSELTILADCFKRVHCVTFGTPPISLLPLQKPPGQERKLRKCLFHSFINEGDPVVRAEKSYIRSLVDLLATSPSSASLLMPATNTALNLGSAVKPSNLYPISNSLLKITNLGVFTGAKKHKQRAHSAPVPSRPHAQTTTTRPVWAVPQGTLSNAGRLVVLRGPEPPPKASTSQVDLTREFEEVGAYTVTDEQIRKVIFGDPMMHSMNVYRRRIEALAMKAVTGRDRFY